MRRSLSQVTLKSRYQLRCWRPVEFWGCWDSTRGRIPQDLLSSNVSGLFTNFSWLFPLLVPDDRREIGAKIDTRAKQFAIIDKYLDEAKQLDLKVFNGNITCNNFHVYPDWFTTIHPGIYMVDQNGEKILLQYEHNIPKEKQRWWTSIEHSVLNQLKREFAQIMCETFGTSDALKMWKIDGESLYPPNVRPGMVGDYSPLARHHFVRWLEEKYNTIDHLNETWATYYADFDEVILPEPYQFTPNVLDWHMFRVQAMIEYVQNQYMVYKSITPERFAFSCVHDVGFRNDELLKMGLSQADYPYVGDGVDVDIIIRPGEEDYNIRYFEVMTSFGKPISSGEYSYFPRPWPSKALRRQVYELLGLGTWSLGLIQWKGSSDCLINWGIQGTEAEEETKRLFRELKSFSPALDMMWPMEPDIRIFISKPTWIMRGWRKEWIELHRALLHTHIDKRYVFDRQLLDSSVKPKVIISVDNDIVDTTVCEKLEEYVSSGGVLVLMGEFGGFDEKLQAGKSQILRDCLALSYCEKESAPYDRGFYRLCYGKGMILRTVRQDVYKAVEDIGEILAEQGSTARVCEVSCSSSLQGKDIEVFTLSDGVNLAVVLINTSDAESVVSIRPEVLCPSATYIVKELVSQTELHTVAESQLAEKQVGTNVGLDPGEAKILYFEKVVAEKDVLETTQQLVECLKGLGNEGFDISQGEAFLQHALSYMEKDNYAKARACLKKVRDMLYMRIEKELKQSDGVTHIRLLLVDIGIQPVKNARLDVWLTPLYDTRVEWFEVKNGEYGIRVEHSKLPRLYDYDSKQYKEYAGKLAVNIDAYSKEREGLGSIDEV